MYCTGLVQNVDGYLQSFLAGGSYVTAGCGAGRDYINGRKK